MLIQHQFSDLLRLRSHKIQVDVLLCSSSGGSNSHSHHKDDDNVFQDFTSFSSSILDDTDAVENHDELLERWFVEFDGSLSSSTSRDDDSYYLSDASELLAVLRMICKRVIMSLRVVYSFARMIPAQKVVENIILQNHGTLDGIYYANNGGGVGSSKFGQDQDDLRNSVIRTICSVIDCSDKSGESRVLLGSDSNFLKHQFQSIPTPFGHIKLKVLYSVDAASRTPRMLGMPVQEKFQEEVQSQTSKIVNTVPSNQSSSESFQQVCNENNEDKAFTDTNPLTKSQESSGDRTNVGVCQIIIIYCFFINEFCNETAYMYDEKANEWIVIGTYQRLQNYRQKSTEY